MNSASKDPNDRYTADEMWWPGGNPNENPNENPAGAQAPADRAVDPPADLPIGESLNVTSSEERRRIAQRALRWMDLHPRRPPANPEPIEDDPVRRRRLMSQVIQALREQDLRQQE